ncbi:hypothetical protein PAXINDRAFT_12509 [Paxillus involutus ATCC 200175]|uniref:Uncharacterized protein n=1 Tax=Paxillus involutus ATCC 200175 TaxID=664439 RepID=A0A0C9TWS4_PAXIN|nr:hypothetical protein PAXINDRAFT_12509 [Paxillus involutus ATCC 200175]
MNDPILSNIFTQHPSGLDSQIFMLIGLALERPANMEDTSGGVLSVREHDLRFTNVSGVAKYHATSLSSSSWTPATSMSSMSVNGNDHTLQSDVEETPKAQAVPLIDISTGTKLAYSIDAE